MEENTAAFRAIVDMARGHQKKNYKKHDPLRKQAQNRTRATKHGHPDTLRRVTTARRQQINKIDEADDDAV